MMKIVPTPSFKRDYKKIQKRGYDLTLLKEVLQLLADKNHCLKNIENTN